MTVADNYAPVIYTGNGVTTTFPFTFSVADADEIVVISRVIATDVDTVVPSGNYTVTGTFPGSGSVEYEPGGSPLEATHKLIIARDVDFVQEMDITNGSGFLPTVLETQLDAMERQIQQLKENLARALQAKVKSAVVDFTIPEPQAGKLLAWDANAEALENVTTIDLGAETLPSTASRFIKRNAAGTAYEAVGATESANLTTLSADIEHIRSIAWYGTLDKTGVASSQTAIAAAVAAAFAGGFDLFWPAGTYLSTASIPNLHNVRHWGAGVIKRGANLFPVQPRYDDTNTIYLDAAAADDTLDGLDSANAIKTHNRIPSVLANYGPVIQTQWFIECAAGTYGGAIYTRKFITLGPNGLITIRGAEVTPTVGNTAELILGGTFGLATVGETLTAAGFTATVISRTNGRVRASLVTGAFVKGQTVTGGTSGLSGPLLWFGGLPAVVIALSADVTKESGFVFGWHQQAILQNVRTSTFNAAGGAGVDARKFCDIRLVNFHDDSSTYGLDVQEFVEYTLTNCCFKTSASLGILELFHIHRNIQGTQSVIHAPAGSGLNSKEMTSGHIDGLIVNLAGEAGIEFHSGTTANVGDLELYNCPIGIIGTSPGEIHVENDIVWGTGADACTRKFVLDDDFTLLSRTGWADDGLTYRPLRQPKSRFLDFADHTVTGTVAAQDYALGTIYANENATKGQSVRVHAKGKRTTGSNGTGTFQLVLGGVACSTVVLPITTVANSAFEVEFDVLCYADGDFQRFFAAARQEAASDGVSGDMQQQDRTETWTANDKAVVLRYTPGHASDSITINDIRMWA